MTNRIIHLLIFTSGTAALSWEVIWQLKASLALGVSALGTALTLAVTMGGMSAGALGMGHLVRRRPVRPLRVYAVLECLIGVSGLFLTAGLRAADRLDVMVYVARPSLAPAVHVASIAATLGVPTLCLGATLPVIGLIARNCRTSIAILYGLNTLGAAGGSLLAAFLLIPSCGVQHTIWIIATLNLVVGMAAWNLDQGAVGPEQRKHTSGIRSGLSTLQEYLVVFTTGFAVFTLEVAWFRSLTAAFHSTTAAFSIILASVLLPLGYGARLVPRLKSKQFTPGLLLGWAGILVLVVTPIVERFDWVASTASPLPAILYLQWFFMTLMVLGGPILLLGILLPWILDSHAATRAWGRLYGFNACASIVGSICAGWILLPTLGFARTAWLAGLVVLGMGIFIASRQRVTLCVVGVLAFAIAYQFESGVGRTRIQIHRQLDPSHIKILQAYEGPDVTVSAIEYKDRGRILVIDGFITTSEANPDSGRTAFRVKYMAWMGRLPMLLHPDPEHALVIAFGTGQTANAVRREKPTSLDIVELNKNVLKLAPYFKTNAGVLNDPMVHTTIMDGRAYLRRQTDRSYDVITLEPMPPTFAGVNALYSREFYQLARHRLTEQGMIAQWLPLHLLHPDTSRSIAKTFQHVFPNAVLWVEPISNTGILVGCIDENRVLGATLPGYDRTGIQRDLSPEEVQEAIALNKEGLARYAQPGDLITDDNQLLAYGNELSSFIKGDWPAYVHESLEAIAAAAQSTRTRHHDVGQ